jgi:cytochrome c peroxidase
MFPRTSPTHFAAARSAGTRRPARALLAAVLAACPLLPACDRKSISDPPLEASLDTQLRATLGRWGAIPIGPVAVQDPAVVSLGQFLFFDKLLSGNRDVACATCHDPAATLHDGLSLSIGTGGVGTAPTRTLGAGRQFAPRNAPSLLNQGLGAFYMFWDGRVSEEGWQSGRFKTPAGDALPSGLTSLLAAQAMFPVTTRQEMRGNAGDVDRFGGANELAQIDDAQFAQIWRAAMQRLLSVQEYVAKFTAAYPGTPASALGFQHAANAIAAFEVAAFTKTNSPFDRYLQRDDAALSVEAKQGALLFFGKALCSTCHSGPLLGGQSFENAGVPQLGPGVGAASPLDRGRSDAVPNVDFFRFAFRVPPLRNVELTAPYMHNGAYRTLEAVVRHYNNVDSALRAFDPSELDAALRGTYHGDAATIDAVEATLDFRLRQPMRLTEEEQRQLVTFLKSLTDPRARDLSGLVPARVPSGLPVRE